MALNDGGMDVIALVKDTERYVFLYDDDSAAGLLKALGRYAADSELSFTWFDAAVLSQKARKLRTERDADDCGDAKTRRVGDGRR